MKTFQEFIVEAKKCWPGYKKKGTKKLFGKTYNNCVKEEFELEESYLIEGQSREDAEKKRLAKQNPNEWRVRKVGRTGEESWTTKRKEALSRQATTRRTNLKGLSYQEILSAVKRDLSVPNSEVRSVARKAHNTERSRKATQTREATKQTQKTGIKHVVDHSQPQQYERKPKYKARFQAVVPGDVSSNRTVVSEPENQTKGSKPPKKGEPGYGATRSGAVSKLINQNKSK